MLRVLLIDDNPIFLDALEDLLTGFPGVDIVGRASSGIDGLRLAQELRPGLVLVDLMMPDLSGIEVSRYLAAAASAHAVVVISLHGGVDYVEAARAAGALTFISKRDLAAELPGLLAGISGDGAATALRQEA
jgi:DNA-binding NarL/FixJ family response regulator